VSARRKLLNGISLCEDPAREACFTVAQHESEMAEFDDFGSPEGRRERLHRHMNNEIGALEIAAQCLVDFPDAPWELQVQLARQAADESRHVLGLYERLRALGGRKGEFPIFNFEWCVTNTQDTLAARLAIQNRTFEAGQMDLLGTLRKLWRDAGDHETADLLEAILADEVNHVRFANRWIRRLAQQDGRVLLKVALAIRFLAEANAAGRSEAPAGQDEKTTRNHARMGTNVEDRRNAEFTDEEIAEILRQSGMSSFLATSRAPVPDGR
jgi:uncharacterized ferritin-like protein (DUF455 family)